MPSENYRVIFVKRPGVVGEPQPDCFQYEPCSYPQLEEGEENDVILKTLYLSMDPAQRCQMNEHTGVDYIQPWEINETVRGLGIGEVIHSNSVNIETGSVVMVENFLWPWMTYWKTSSKTLRLVDTDPKDTLAYYALVGPTSLLGLQEKGHIMNGEGKGKSFVVSGAAGSCGSLAGQFARVYGCHPVIGICGSAFKCGVLRNDLQFTNAINYKNENVDDKIKEFCPNGVDVYFDNVGGEVSDSVIRNMNKGSHIILCGQISQYNKTMEYPPRLSQDIQDILVERNVTRERFLVLNYRHKFPQALKDLHEMKEKYDIKILVTPYEGLESAGIAFSMMFQGENTGKALVCVS